MLSLDKYIWIIESYFSLEKVRGGKPGKGSSSCRGGSDNCIRQETGGGTVEAEEGGGGEEEGGGGEDKEEG